MQGVNQAEMRNKNRGLVLKQIGTSPGISRADIATRTGLTKTTITNVVQELLQQNYVCEQKKEEAGQGSGRPPIELYISKQAPLICGMLLKRNITTVFLATLANDIVDQINISFEAGQIDPQLLLEFLINSYKALAERNSSNQIFGIGISCVGVIDNVNGIILNPPHYFAYPCEFPLIQLLMDKIKVPIYLMHDCSAAILAQQLYAKEETQESFAYLCLEGGIGIGFILDGKVYDGLLGQGGELGHCSIDYQGEQCVCGNNGCLELYANEKRLTEHLHEYQDIFPNHPLMHKNKLLLADFIKQADHKDTLSIVLLREYTQYIATALVNVINLLDISQIVLEYENSDDSYCLENMLQTEIENRLLTAKYKQIQVIRSKFKDQLSLKGCTAIVATQVFQGSNLL